MKPSTSDAPASVCAQGGWMQRAQVVMGRSVTVQVWADDRSRGAAAMAAVMAEMQRIARVCDPQRPASELAMLNVAAAAQPVPVSDEVFQLLARAQAFARLSDGAFDPTCGAVTLAFERQRGEPADELSLARAVQAVGWRHLLLDPATRSVRLARAGVRLDLAGFAKGYALDRCVALLQRQSVRHALVSVGGDTRLLGDRRGSPWTIALRDPDDADLVRALLPLQDLAVSTAVGRRGEYRPRAPVIDPRSGRPPAGLRSATVIAPEGITAHALAKAALVLGVERALELVHAQAAVDAVLVDADGRLHVSAGLQDLRQAPPPGRAAVRAGPAPQSVA
jgi:thiamine biosynthesis lipoprotein